MAYVIAEKPFFKSFATDRRYCLDAHVYTSPQLETFPMKRIACSVLAGLFFTLPALAQDGPPAAVELPEICKPMMQTDMGALEMDMSSMDQAHQDLAKGMNDTNAQMMQGMMASDIDGAFVCAMIPHHQAAINMANAELAHGDSDWAKGMAQKVIDAQQKEIDEMLNWLNEQK